MPNLRLGLQVQKTGPASQGPMSTFGVPRKSRVVVRSASGVLQDAKLPNLPDIHEEQQDCKNNRRRDALHPVAGSHALHPVVGSPKICQPQGIWEFPTMGGPNMDPKMVGLLL